MSTLKAIWSQKLTKTVTIMYDSKTASFSLSQNLTHETLNDCK